ncbi:MAG: S8 family serine peptidase, partial [Phaeodactylibacter sp.]|nr:S8 family serine peptidase [Phaeodactylibacter sp.]
MKKNVSIALIACILWSFHLSLFAQDSSTFDLLLQAENLQMPENIRDFNKTASVKKNEEIENRFYRLLQFYKLPSKAEHERIRKSGIELLDYVPNKTYIASIPTSIDGETLLNLNVRSILEIPEYFKSGPNLELSPSGTWADSPETVEVHFKYYADIKPEAINAYCQADKMEILQSNGYNNFILARVHKDQVFELARLPYISFVDLAPEPGEPEDTPGRSLHRANAIDTDYAGGRKYTGAGVAVLTRDDGDVGPHIDFQGRLYQNDNPGGPHGDGVSGIFAGAGNLNPAFRGMASGADLYVIDYEPSFLDNTMNLHYNSGVLVTNSSYSNGCNTGYTLPAATVDQQIFQNPTLIHVFAAGNANPNNCGYGAGNQWGNITGGHKQGKNVIAAANIYNNGTLVSSSSHGPAYDGRIKPDIAANGAEHISTLPNNLYWPFGGTSGASPGIAGITAMLHEAYAQYHASETAESALLKAILLNTANDMGNPGPDFHFGWGNVNALRAVRTIEEDRLLSDIIDQGELQVHTLNIPDNVAYARIMLYWTDRPALPGVATALINDLD